MRTNLDDDSLQELKADMKANGLIEPVVLRPMGKRYELIAGARRTRAARLLGWGLIEATIRKCTDEEAFAMRLAENLQRQDVDPVDEAAYIGEIMLRTKKTPAEVAAMLHRSAEWVRVRLAVFEMPDYLKRFLAMRQITLGVALELAEIKTEYTRKYYANWAAQNGVTVATAKRWKAVANDASERLGVAPPADPQTIRATPTPIIMQECAECAVSAPIEEMQSVYVHTRCPERATEEVSVAPTPSQNGDGNK